MSTHVLLNLLKEFGKRDKMRGVSDKDKKNLVYAIVKGRETFYHRYSPTHQL